MGTMTLIEKLRSLGFDGNEVGHEAADEILRLRNYIWSLDGKTLATRGENNTFLDEGMVVASDILGPPEDAEPRARSHTPT